MEKKKILLIDDEKDFTKLVKLNLEKTGRYEVKTENKGRQGLTVAKEFKPDLILLDLLMPDIQGGEVAQKIQEDKGLRIIPIVFLTAAATKEEVASRGGMVGGRPFIAKPVSTEELIVYIEENIARKPKL